PVFGDLGLHPIRMLLGVAKHLQRRAVNLIAGAVKLKVDGHIAAAGLRVNPQLVALLPNLGRNTEFGGTVDDVLSGRHVWSPSALAGWIALPMDADYGIAVSESSTTSHFFDPARLVDGGVDAIRILVPQVQPLGNFPIPQPPIPRRILPQPLVLSVCVARFGLRGSLVNGREA